MNLSGKLSHQVKEVFVKIRNFVTEHNECGTYDDENISLSDYVQINCNVFKPRGELTGKTLMEIDNDISKIENNESKKVNV